MGTTEILLWIDTILLVILLLIVLLRGRVL